MSEALILVGDVRRALAHLDAESVQCCVTSPPYWGLRDYGHDGQIGLEKTPEAYVSELVAVFREVRRVLRADGTLWLNLGDSYSGSGPSGASYQSTTTRRREAGDGVDGVFRVSRTLGTRGLTYAQKKPIPAPGLKHKDLVGIPWRVAFALQADGWYLRSDIIWAKPNPMPESVTDRPTKAHEYVFLLTKSARYYYDHVAVKEPALNTPGGRLTGSRRKKMAEGSAQSGTSVDTPGTVESRNARSVWTITPRPYKGAHFATMPVELAERCIMAGSREGDLVLDPFGGAGTTGLAAHGLGRSSVLVELNPEYATLAKERVPGADLVPVPETMVESGAELEAASA